MKFGSFSNLNRKFILIFKVIEGTQLLVIYVSFRKCMVNSLLVATLKSLHIIFLLKLLSEHEIILFDSKY